MLLVSFSLAFPKNLASVLLHTNLIIYHTTFRSTFSHASLGGVISIPPHMWRKSRSLIPFLPLIEISADRCGRLPLGSTNRKSPAIPMTTPKGRTRLMRDHAWQKKSPLCTRDGSLSRIVLHIAQWSGCLHTRSGADHHTHRGGVYVRDAQGPGACGVARWP